MERFIVNNLKILHVLGYSLPNLSGYTIRSKYLIESEKDIGLQPIVITSPKYEHEKPFISEVSYNDIRYHRTRDYKTTFQIPFIHELLFKGNLLNRPKRTDRHHSRPLSKP
jgi:hypothetical protein